MRFARVLSFVPDLTAVSTFPKIGVLDESIPYPRVCSVLFKFAGA